MSGNLLEVYVPYKPLGVPITTVTDRSDTDSSAHNKVTYNTSKTTDVVAHTATDAPTGQNIATFGPLQVNYSAKTLVVRLVELSASTKGYKSDFEDAAAFNAATETSSAGSSVGSGSGGNTAAKGGDYSDAAIGEQVLAASTLQVTYAVGFASPQNATKVYTPAAVVIDLTPNSADYIVPNSVRFTWMGHVFEDYDGVLVRDRTASFNGYVAGQLDYAAGLARVTDYVVDPGTLPSTFTLQSLWTVRQNWTTASIFMRTQAAPMAPAGFVMNLSDTAGNSITATGDLNGNLTGTHLRGKIDYETGLVEMQFGDFVLDSALTAAQKLEWWYDLADVGAVEPLKIWRPWPVDPTTLRYNSVTYFYLPLDADILGIDPVRLPPDGRVPIFRPGGFVVVGNSKAVNATVGNGQVINAGRVRLSRVRIKGADGAVINTGYTANLEAGTVTINDITGWQQPVEIEHRVEDMAVVADVQINGTLRLTRQLSHAFTAGDSYVSSALIAGNRKARVSHLFDQDTWDGSWINNAVGNGAIAQFNDVQFPVLVKNFGALTERWTLRFKNTTTVQVIGEHVGVLGDFPIVAEIAPINPATQTPYFRVPPAGWGSGWSVGNVLRINTVGTPYPFNVARTVQQGTETVLDHAFEIVTRGDVDAPAP